MLTERLIDKTVALFLADLKQAGYQVEKAWLFGSVVRGNVHEYSDIDLAVWDKQFMGCRPVDYEKILSILRRYPKIELHTFAIDDNADNNPFVGEIEATGRMVA